ncbi:MAG: MerR family transcriptional regulator [Fibrella sp.]|nr:MerR family transcriptional regulator [Armatimonadota bacterium]
METVDESDEPVYVISVAARLADLPAWFLRVLDDEGIVVPKRTDSSRRLYSARDLNRLARVRYLTEDRKVNIAGIKVIFEMEAVWHAERSGQEPVKRPVSSDAPPTELNEVLALLPAYNRDK